MTEQQLKSIQNFYNKSSKGIWIGILLVFISGVGMLYSGFQLYEGIAPIHTDASLGRAVSGRNEPKDSYTDSYFEKQNDRVTDLMKDGVFSIIISLTAAGVMLHFRKLAKGQSQ